MIWIIGGVGAGVIGQVEDVLDPSRTIAISEIIVFPVNPAVECSDDDPSPGYGIGGNSLVDARFHPHHVHCQHVSQRRNGEDNKENKEEPWRPTSLLITM